jgi:predicted DCC family thiol-disulfide oxidoreductase YuxK
MVVLAFVDVGVTVDPDSVVRRLPCLRTKESAMSKPTGVTVYHDGACPLCSREIAFYRRRRSASAITWVDVAAIEDKEIADDLTRDAAMSRFHVRSEDGTLVSGGAAFQRLWSALPAFYILGHVAGWPGVRILLEWGYRLSLRFRPLIARRLRS